MVTYVIASKANASQLAHCQILGEYIELNVPDISVKYVIKDKSEWKPFINSVCKCYGFDNYKLCPIVYTLEGQLVGDGTSFIEHIKERYDINLSLTKESLKSRAKQNIENTAERIRKRDEGDTLGEKIQNFLDKDTKSKDKKQVVKLIDDTFYLEEWERGIPFYVRRTDVLRDFSESNTRGLNQNRTLNIPDTDLEEAKVKAVFQEAEEKRDQTWEEFLEKFTDHIEGKVDPNIRTKGRYDENNPRPGDEDEDDVAVDDSKATRSQPNRSGLGSASSNPGTEKEKYDIPNSCKLEMLRANKVEDLGMNYRMTQHPYPQIEGEMLIFQLNLEDKSEKEKTVVYRDYSLKKRLQTVVKKYQSAVSKKKQIEDDTTRTKLQCFEINTEAPLSSIDWQQLATTIIEIQSLTWFQILPVGQKSSQPYQFNCIHALPNSKHPFPNTPLDSMIANKMKYMRKQNKTAKAGGQLYSQASHQYSTKEKEADAQGLILVNEFDFPHAVFEILPTEMSSDGLQLGYRKLSTFLNLKENQTSGVTCIITPSWMFLATLANPYHIEQDKNGREIPVYHDGFAYSGILNIQDIKQVWPQTTSDIGHEQHGILSSLQAQAEPAQQN